jgi:hypothetical protein
MALTGWLETENLLGIIVLLLSTSNFYQARIKSALVSLGKFVKEDIKIRSRLEAKANWLMRKAGVDIEAFDAAIEINTNLNGFDFND